MLHPHILDLHMCIFQILRESSRYVLLNGTRLWYLSYLVSRFVWGKREREGVKELIGAQGKGDLNNSAIVKSTERNRLCLS